MSEMTDPNEIYQYISDMIDQRNSYFDNADNNAFEQCKEDFFQNTHALTDITVDFVNHTHENLLQRIRDNSYRMMDLFTRIRSVKALMPQPLPNLEDFTKIYNWIRSEYGVSGITFNDYSGMTIHGIRAILTESDPITRTSFKLDLGNFDVRIYFNYSDITRLDIILARTIQLVEAHPVGENQPKKINGEQSPCYHPHVRRDSALCLGSYGDDIRIEIGKLNFLSVIQGVCRLMRRYNANSLMFQGAYINNWIGEKCSCCNLFVGDSLVRCASSGLPMHKTCAVQHNDKYYIPNLIKKCHTCGTLCSPECYTAVSPRQYICNECPLP